MKCFLQWWRVCPWCLFVLYWINKNIGGSNLPRDTWPGYLTHGLKQNSLGLRTRELCREILALGLGPADLSSIRTSALVTCSKIFLQQSCILCQVCFLETKTMIETKPAEGNVATEHAELARIWSRIPHTCQELQPSVCYSKPLGKHTHPPQSSLITEYNFTDFGKGVKWHWSSNRFISKETFASPPPLLTDATPG